MRRDRIFASQTHGRRAFAWRTDYAFDKAAPVRWREFLTSASVAPGIHIEDVVRFALIRQRLILAGRARRSNC
jgi:hypothetical protein